MSEKWLLNEDIYLLHWYIKRGMSLWHMAKDLERTEAAVKRRVAFLQSPKGQMRATIAATVHAKCREMARDILEMEELGFSVDAWMEGYFPVNDFNAAAMPEYFDEEASA